jgi:hypothetical protein
MNLTLLYKKKLTEEIKEDMKKKFCSQFKLSESQFYSVLKHNVKDLPVERALFFASYFTINKSVDELIKITSKKEKKSQIPNSGDLTLKELLK